MPVTLSIEDAPDDLVRRLQNRAHRHRRSLQSELRAIVEDAVRPETGMSVMAILEEVRRLGIRTEPTAAATIRADRDRPDGL